MICWFMENIHPQLFTILMLVLITQIVLTTILFNHVKFVAIVNFCEMQSLEIIILVAKNFSSVTRRLGGSFDLTNLRFQLQDLSCESNDLSMLVDFQLPVARCNQIGVIRTSLGHKLLQDHFLFVHLPMSFKGCELRFEIHGKWVVLKCLEKIFNKRIIHVCCGILHVNHQFLAVDSIAK